MHKSNFYISFGIWLFILPFFGVPGSWKNVLVSLSGIFLVLVIAGPSILNKLQIKPKIKNKQSESDLQNDKLKFSNTENNQIEKEKEV
jgi:hypothetical protein